MQEFTIGKNEAGQRLDKYLGRILKEAPVSFFYKMMRKKNIVLNGTKCTGREQLSVGDSVKLFLSDETIEKLAEAMGTYAVTLTPLMNGIRELAKSFMQNDVHVSGEKNLLARNDIGAEDVINFLERKNEFSKLLDDSFSGLRVMFGEDGGFVISNSSMIVSPIKKGGKTAGSLGLIGPMRLDYAKIIPYIEYLTDKISDILTESADEPQQPALTTAALPDDKNGKDD